MNINLGARNFYAVSLIAFGAQQCIYGKLIAGRPFPWPASLPGEQLVAYIIGILLILAGIFIFIRLNQTALIITGVFIIIWCACRNIVETIARQDVGFLLTNTGKALSLGSGAFLVLDTFNHQNGFSGTYSFFKKWHFLCSYCMAFFLCVSGIQHFIYVDFVKSLIPSWIPGNVFWVYAAGVLLLVTGLSVFTGIKARVTAATTGAIMLIWFFILHLPRAIADLNNQNETTAAFEALAFSGLLFLIGHTSKKSSSVLVT